MRLWLLLAVCTGCALSVSNRTACFTYINCLEYAQATFKSCAGGTAVALALESRDRVFHETANTQMGIVRSCQKKLEFDSLDFDAMQVLVNEDSRECFRRLPKRRRRRIVNVPDCPIESPPVRSPNRSPYQCLQDFKIDRRRCERLLICCPEHVKCAESLNSLSIAYQEAKTKSIEVSENMIDCVYQLVGADIVDEKRERNNLDESKSPLNQKRAIASHGNSVNSQRKRISTGATSRARLTTAAPTRVPLQYSLTTQAKRGTTVEGKHDYAKIMHIPERMRPIEEAPPPPPSGGSEYSFGPISQNTKVVVVPSGPRQIEKSGEQNGFRSSERHQLPAVEKIPGAGDYNFGPRIQPLPLANREKSGERERSGEIPAIDRETNIENEREEEIKKGKLVPISKEAETEESESLPIEEVNTESTISSSTSTATITSSTSTPSPPPMSFKAKEESGKREVLASDNIKEKSFEENKETAPQKGIQIPIRPREGQWEYPDEVREIQPKSSEIYDHEAESPSENERAAVSEEFGREAEVAKEKIVESIEEDVERSVKSPVSTSSPSTSRPDDVTFEVESETVFPGRDESSETRSTSASAELPSESSFNHSLTRDEAEKRVEIVKYLLESADPMESTIYLELIASGDYSELERIAIEKKAYLAEQESTSVDKSVRKRDVESGKAPVARVHGTTTLKDVVPEEELQGLIKRTLLQIDNERGIRSMKSGKNPFVANNEKALDILSRKITRQLLQPNGETQRRKVKSSDEKREKISAHALAKYLKREEKQNGRRMTLDDTDLTEKPSTPLPIHSLNHTPRFRPSPNAPRQQKEVEIRLPLLPRSSSEVTKVSPLPLFNGKRPNEERMRNDRTHTNDAVMMENSIRNGKTISQNVPSVREKFHKEMKLEKVSERLHPSQMTRIEWREKNVSRRKSNEQENVRNTSGESQIHPKVVEDAKKKVINSQIRNTVDKESGERREKRRQKNEEELAEILERDDSHEDPKLIISKLRKALDEERQKLIQLQQTLSARSSESSTEKQSNVKKGNLKIIPNRQSIVLPQPIRTEANYSERIRPRRIGNLSRSIPNEVTVENSSENSQFKLSENAMETSTANSESTTHAQPIQNISTSTSPADVATFPNIFTEPSLVEEIAESSTKGQTTVMQQLLQTNFEKEHPVTESSRETLKPMELESTNYCSVFATCQDVVRDYEEECDRRFSTEMATFGIDDISIRLLLLNNSQSTNDIAVKTCMKPNDKNLHVTIRQLEGIKRGVHKACLNLGMNNPDANREQVATCSAHKEISTVALDDFIQTATSKNLNSRRECFDKLDDLKEQCLLISPCCASIDHCTSYISTSPVEKLHSDAVVLLLSQQRECERKMNEALEKLHSDMSEKRKGNE